MRTRSSFFAAISSERGIAVPVSLTVLLIMAMLGAAVLIAATTAVNESSRDRSVKRSVAAADAGIDIATNRLNRLAPKLGTTEQCVVVDGSGTLTAEAVQSDGWCRAQTESLEDNSSFRYRVSAPQKEKIDGRGVWQRRIVSIGAVSGVERRAIATVAAPNGSPLFAYGVYSELDLTMQNSAKVTADVRSDGHVNLENFAKVCGDVVVGPERDLNGDQNCAGASNEAEDFVYLSPVILPPSNHNYRLTSGEDPRSGAVSWDPAARTLSVEGGTVTLRGGAYVFCSMHVSKDGRVVIENDGTPVKIFIDAPENCPSGDPSPGSVLFEKKGKIDNEGAASMAQIYMVGSETIKTTFDFENNEKADVRLTLYAPNTEFNIWNYGTLVGAVVAKQVTMQNNSEIIWDASAAEVEQPLLHLYHRRAWVECTPAPTGNAPDSGC